MAKREPSKRALAFKAWMAAVGTNTKRVSARSGVPYTTLASFVQGDTQSLKGDNEDLIAQAFNATAAEMFAEGGAAGYVPIVGRVGADNEGRVLLSTGQVTGDMAPIPPGGSTDSVALEVTGHSMRGLADDGALLYFEDQRTPPSPDMIGYPCIVETEDGRVLIKKLLKGSRVGLYDLESLYGPTLEDVRLRWAAEITAIIPPRAARRAIRRRGEAA
jgi:hypothetical protein